MFEGISLPFGVGELMTNSSELLMVIGGIILIPLGMRVMDELVTIIKLALNTENSAHNLKGRFKVHFGRKIDLRRARKNGEI